MQKNKTGGLLPPQAIELEEAVLGATLLESRVLPLLMDVISSESFYVDANARIFQSCINLYNQNKPVDILTVVQELKRLGDLEKSGGAFYIAQLTNRVASSENAEFHARIIQQHYLKRELIRLNSAIISRSYDDSSDIFDITSELEKGLTLLMKHLHVGKVGKVGDQWQEIERKNAILLQNKGISGVPSGLIALDKITGGFQNSDLIILAARPAMGKTSLAVCIARNASVQFNLSVLVFSLEMSSIQLAIRAFSLESNEPIENFSRKGVPSEQMIFIEKDCKKLINAPLYIDDTPAITLQELRSKSRKFKREKDIKIIIVDYLQIMGGDGSKGNREQEISTISRGLKALAKELDIPIIALAQLSRSVESLGGDKRPILSDLRESGAIEQDADIVAFVHRPEYYGITEYDAGISTAGVAEIIIAKHRNGAIDTAMTNFNGKLTKFSDIGEVYSAPIETVEIKEPQPLPKNESFLSENKIDESEVNKKPWWDVD